MTVFQEQGRGALEHLLPRLPRNGKKATSPLIDPLAAGIFKPEPQSKTSA
jgi:hypothetical protein